MQADRWSATSWLCALAVDVALCVCLAANACIHINRAAPPAATIAMPEVAREPWVQGCMFGGVNVEDLDSEMIAAANAVVEAQTDAERRLATDRLKREQVLSEQRRVANARDAADRERCNRVHGCRVL